MSDADCLETNDTCRSVQVEEVVRRLEIILDAPSVSQAVGQKAIDIINNLMEGDTLALSTSAHRYYRSHLLRIIPDHLLLS